MLIQYAELESILGDTARARAIYRLAIAQPRLDMPEMLWKAYIDFEIEGEEYDKTRDLYRQLLGRTNHVKVWRQSRHGTSPVTSRYGTNQVKVRHQSGQGTAPIM